MILVTGATSVIGQKLCELLAAHKKPFRAMCRKEEQLQNFRQQNIEAVLGDFTDTDSLRLAMEGCDTLFLVSPPNEKQLESEKKAIDAAKEEGITYIVRVSASDANLRISVPWAKAHAHIDHYLRSSGIAWTILKPTAFMQNFLTMTKPISKGYLPQIGGKGLVGYIDAKDIGVVAYHVLTAGEHKRATYYLNGPEALDMNEIAQQLSSVIGKKVRYLNLPSIAFRLLLRATGASRWLANGLVEQYAEVVAKHHDHDLGEEVYRLTGQQPSSFMNFAQAHRERFLGS
ncbi:SDR family oxidoreductase [Mucilaginibacter daejeonensis]|uniref:SDR family oxidoreductase n=1 Tax=Mucilaginibacter daejeonensis TaxID=398049 RepID=UPI001D17AB17|nr:SDR family oxidoreductase [Mucilaginibacter daejeonensis]UEG52498.1 SDR family oxidoreductase [Mucilaginibacter daejeonensis]